MQKKLLLSCRHTIHSTTAVLILYLLYIYLWASSTAHAEKIVTLMPPHNSQHNSSVNLVPGSYKPTFKRAHTLCCCCTRMFKSPPSLSSSSVSSVCSGARSFRNAANAHPAKPSKPREPHQTPNQPHQTHKPHRTRNKQRRAQHGFMLERGGPYLY